MQVSSWLCTLTTGGLSLISAERFCRTIWSPSFRYTIRYENGLVGMDMKNIREVTSYKTMDNTCDSEVNPGSTRDIARDITHDGNAGNEIECLGAEPPAPSTLRRNSSLTNAMANPKRDNNPWGANERQPLKKKYVVVYSQPPGVSEPEDMQPISTV